MLKQLQDPKKNLDLVIGQILDERYQDEEVHKTLDRFIPNLRALSNNMVERGLQYERSWLAVKAANYFIENHKYGLDASSFVGLYDMLMKVGFNQERGFRYDQARNIVSSLGTLSEIIMEKKEPEAILKWQRNLFVYWHSSKYGVKHLNETQTHEDLRNHFRFTNDKIRTYFKHLSYGEEVISAYNHLAQHAVDTANSKKAAFESYIEKELFPLMDALEAKILHYNKKLIRTVKESLNPIRKQLTRRDNPLYKLVNDRLSNSLK